MINGFGAVQVVSSRRLVSVSVSISAVFGYSVSDSQILKQNWGLDLDLGLG